MDSWRRFRQLSGRERGLLVRAIFLLPLTAVALRLVGFRRWQAMLTRLVPEELAAVESQPSAFLERAYQTARMVHVAGRRGLGRPNCLQQSLVLWWLLRRQGIAGELRVGVRKQARRFEAHAWVEHLGIVLNDCEDVHLHYAPFKDPLPSGHAEPR